MPPDQQPQGGERFHRHEARRRVRLGSREFSWRQRSRPYRSVKAEAAEAVLRFAAPVVLWIVALKLAEPWRLILLLGAVLLGVLVVKWLVTGFVTALRTRLHRHQATAENAREGAQITARYEQQLKETQSRYRAHSADPATGSGEADSP